MIQDSEYDLNAEISVSLYENAGFLPHDPIFSFIVPLKDLIIKCSNFVIKENEPGKYSLFIQVKFEPIEIDITANFNDSINVSFGKIKF